MAAGKTVSRGTVMVSGASGAIGEAICRALHADGWELVLGYVTRDRAERLAASVGTPDVPALALPLDLDDVDGCGGQTNEILTQVGRLDGVVFNGGYSETGFFPDTDEAAWWHTVNINFLGPMAVVRRCLPAMIDGGGGVIVGITSEAAKVGDAGHAPYAAAKAALAAFCKTIVREHGRHGIRASCVAPGPIDTPMLRYAFDSEEHAERAVARMRQLIPLPRLGRPEEVAAAVRFLVSDALYVAGEQISVGGGVSMQ